MDFDRRLQIAEEGARVLDDLVSAVEESWRELMPAAAGWTEVGRGRARRAARAALEGILAVAAQGDLSDRNWVVTRLAVFAGGEAQPEEAAELLRSVRIVGVERLADHLNERLGLTRDERWELQRRAAVFCDEVLGVAEETAVPGIDALLAELHGSGADLR